jgi:CRISPR-associated protein Cas5t
MNFLEIKFEGWTATPRMPFILSGNAICTPAPSYSLVLGIIGCCLGRIVEAQEVNVGYHYQYENPAYDIETRQRLESDGNTIKPHYKGSDAYEREFHTNPELTIWLNRTDWEEYFLSPKGTPSLGRSQDILKITSVKMITANPIQKATIAGCMLPFIPSIQTNGQLVQLAESFVENDIIGSGRKSTASKIFIAIPYDNQKEITYHNLYEYSIESNTEKKTIQFYLHDWR